MDTLTPAQRSERMSRVRNKNTKPEMLVRRLVHGMGYGYRLHRKGRPGRPDLVFPGCARSFSFTDAFGTATPILLVD
jgi:DNA mismatch endonuclease (patch repair protein)